MRRALILSSLLAVPQLAAMAGEGPEPKAASDSGQVASAPAMTLVAEAPPARLTPSAPLDQWPRFAAHPFLLSAHIAAGVEPHDFICQASVAAACTMFAFNAGGEALWHGLIGFSLGLYAAAGSPLVPGNATQTGFADRISANVSLALRPLAPYAWKSGDSWPSRFLGGVGVEIGPSLEYLRTSSTTVVGCNIPAVAFEPGLHAALSLELPLIGDARSGWLSLRVSERVIVSKDVQLAPSNGCTALVVEPGVATQTLFGLSYTL